MITSLASLALAMIPAVPAPASSLPPCPDPGTGFYKKICDEGGISTGWTLEEVAALARAWPPGSPPSAPTSWYEYVGVIDCMPPNSIEEPKLEICQPAVDRCVGVGDYNINAFTIIFRREVAADGEVLDTWKAIGGTCYTDAVPPRSGESAVVLTEAMIIEQFHRTDFALPEIVIQPPDGQTLVNLPVYFQLSWPEAGFEPQEIDTTTIIGHEVRIKPTLIGVTYFPGDGSSIGPTTSLGGPYPSGDITHEYANAASVAPSITVEYGGEVSVDGADWRPIPGSATVEGPAAALEVLTSRNRLYDN